MLKAVLRKGAIVPVDPVPSDWEEGTALEVAKSKEGAVNIDAWAKMMNELCAASSADEEERMRKAIDDHRRQAKAQVRKDMGLSA
jgi:hypothetical protein